MSLFIFCSHCLLIKSSLEATDKAVANTLMASALDVSSGGLEGRVALSAWLGQVGLALGSRQ